MNVHTNIQIQKDTNKEITEETEPNQTEEEDDDQRQHHQHHQQYNMVQRAAVRVARYPKSHLFISLLIAVAVSAAGMVWGDFSVSANNGGWQSRGTLISNRQTQLMVVTNNVQALFEGDADVWQYYLDTVQPGWEIDEGIAADKDPDDRRKLVQYQRRRQQQEQEQQVDVLPTNSRAPSQLPSSSVSAVSAVQQKVFRHLLYRHLQTTLTIIEDENTTTVNPNTNIPPTTSSTALPSNSEKPDTVPTTSNTTSTVPPSDSALFFGTLTSSSSSSLAGCDTDWYTDGRMLNASRLWPVWKVTNAREASALDPQLLEDLCSSEEATQRILQEHNLCFGCPGEETTTTTESSSSSSSSSCLPPYSLTLIVRLIIPNGMDMDCTTLAQTYANLQFQKPAEQTLLQCVEAVENIAALEDGGQGMPSECLFYPSIVDEFFDTTERISYTSSIYATYDSEQAIQDMYDLVDEYDRGTKNLQGAYDTQLEDFVNILMDKAVNSDMVLSVGSAFITAMAILIHTRSPFITVIGLVEIILAFPLAYFTYRIICGLVFFPFLNFIGVFILFSLGADHIFVSVDKWKNARKDFPHLSTEDIAAKALPDAAEAMFLTTSTTAIAFFGTAICPVAPVKLFAIFCGLLIVWDYIMDVLLIFPSLCIYDGFRDQEKPNCCITCHSCSMLEGGKDEINDDSDLDDDGNNNVVDDKDYGADVEEKNERELAITEDKEDGSYGRDRMDTAESTPASSEIINDLAKDDAVVNTAEDHHFHIHHYKDIDEDHKPSLIRRILLNYYRIIHYLRWPLLACCACAFAVCLWKALSLDLPTTSEVRVLRSDHEFEKAFSWRLHLLNEVIEKQGGSQAQVIWGVAPADTGDNNDPASWSQLVLDQSFDPSPREAQVYLRDFCDKFFAQDFASKVTPDFECPINVFDQWLRNQSRSTDGTDVAYANCNSATGLPMDPAFFHSCLTEWAQQEDEMNVLSRSGVVEIMYFPFASRVRYETPQEKLDEEWHRTEDWFDKIQETAPEQVKKAYFSSLDFWWYDTNAQMFNTAMGSAAIAISASAAIIAFSSRSLTMTLFAIISVAYVLASVTSMMVVR